MRTEMLEVGVQLHLPTYREYTMPDLIHLARNSVSVGARQIWVTDNYDSRNIFTVLAGLATATKVKLGAAVAVQYFRSPVEAASAIGAVSELMDGRELSVGIGRGRPDTGLLVEMPSPADFMEETAKCLRALVSGERTEMDTFRLLSRYFNFAAGASPRLAFTPPGPICLYGGGNGPRSLAVAGALMDGVVFGWTLLPAAGLGKLGELMAIFERAAERGNQGRPVRRIAEVKVSVARERERARDFVKDAVTPRMLSLREHGYRVEDWPRLGIDPAVVERLENVGRDGGAGTGGREEVTEAMVDALYVAGDPGECRERMTEVAATVREHGFDQVMLSELGPDPAEAIELLGNEVLPHL